MDQKPADYFVGIISFFAVMLPGAVVAIFGMDLATAYVSRHPEVFGAGTSAVHGELQGWVIFLFAAYLAGQFVALAGTPLDSVYDFYRRLMLWLHQRAVGNLALVAWLTKPWADNQGLYASATAVKQQQPKDSGAEAANTFKWAKAVLELSHPTAAVELHRLEAEQKFFRGLIVVLLLICALFLFVYHYAWVEVLPYVLLMVLSFIRYTVQRRKTTDAAYTYLIASQRVAPGQGQ